MTKEEYKINQKDKKRIDGTTIGKQAMRDFVRGIKLRMNSSVTSLEMKMAWEDNKFAVAFYFFQKWLAEIKEFDEVCDEKINTPVMMAWIEKYGKMRYIQNWYSNEPKSIKIFVEMARRQLKTYRRYYKRSKMCNRKEIEEKKTLKKILDEI